MKDKRPSPRNLYMIEVRHNGAWMACENLVFSKIRHAKIQALANREWYNPSDIRISKFTRT